MQSIAWKGDHPITSYYGWRTNPISGVRSFHDGVDVSMPIGTELYSPIDGKVRLAKTDTYGGKYIQVVSSDGKGHWCLHLSEFKCKVGDIVKQGQLIGLSGNTGQSTGPHTHFGEQSNATVWTSHIDPLASLQVQSQPARFKKGDKIVFTDIQNIRKGSGTTYEVISSSVVGQTGVVWDEPRQSDGYWFYDIHIDEGGSGWCADVGKFQIFTQEETPIDYQKEIDRLLEANRGLSMALGASEDLLKTRDGELSEARGAIKLLEANLEEAKNDYANMEESYTKVLEAKERIEQEKLVAQEELDILRQKTASWEYRLADILHGFFNKK